MNRFLALLVSFCFVALGAVPPPTQPTLKTFNTISDMVAALPTVFGTNCLVLGRTTANDGGGGYFYTAPELVTTTTNTGTIFRSSSNTNYLWTRIYSGPVNVLWFGAKGDGVTDDSTAIQSAYLIAGNPNQVVFPPGNYKFTQSGSTQWIVGGSDVNTIGAKTYADILASADTNIVYAGGYQSVSSAAANLSSGVTERHYFDYANVSRVRQDGNIVQCELYLDAKPAQLTAFYFEVWRSNGNGLASWDRVSREDILPLLSAGINTVTLANPVAALEGDWVGFGWTASSDPGDFLTTISSGSDTDGMWQSDADPGSVGVAWKSQTSAGTVYVPIRTKMTAPYAIFIGDSIICGANWHNAYTVTPVKEERQSVFPWKVGRSLGITYQNMGIGSQTTTQIASRFTTDVINLHPKLVIMEGGINDVVSSTNSFYTNWQTMLAAAQSAGIKVAITTILPRTANSTPEATTVDTLNTWLLTLPSQYSNVIGVFDSELLLGQFRPGGTAGNLWDMRPAYVDTDGTHPTRLGYSQMARGIISAISDLQVNGSLSAGDANIRKDVVFAKNLGPHRIYTESSVVPEQPGSDLLVQAGGAAPVSTNQSGGYLHLSSGSVSGSGASEIVFNVAGGFGSSGSVHLPVGVAHLGNTYGGVGLTNSAARWTVKGGSSGNPNLFQVQNSSGTDIADVFFDGSGHGVLDIKNSAAAVKMRFWSGGAGYINTGFNFGIGNASPTYLFSVGSASQLGVDASGNLGIGVDPGYSSWTPKIGVKSSGGGSGDGIAVFGSNNTNIVLLYQGPANDGVIDVKNSASATTARLWAAGDSYINTGHNLGVGNSSPTYLFSVGSASQFGVDSSGRLGAYIAPSANALIGVKKSSANGVNDTLVVFNANGTNVVGSYIDSTGGGGDGVTDWSDHLGVNKARIYASGPSFVSDDFQIVTAGKTLSLKTGSNAAVGSVTLTNGQATVFTTALDANSLVFATIQAPIGTFGGIAVTNKVTSTSFEIRSSSATDASVVGWWIMDTQ